MSARTSRSSSTMACSASAVALCGGCRARRRARRRIRPARRAVPRPRRAIAVVWCVDPPVTGLQLSFLKPAEPEPRRSPGRDGGGRSREAPSRSIARGRASPGWPQGSLFRCSRRLNPGVSTGASMGQWVREIMLQADTKAGELRAEAERGHGESNIKDVREEPPYLKQAQRCRVRASSYRSDRRKTARLRNCNTSPMPSPSRSAISLTGERPRKGIDRFRCTNHPGASPIACNAASISGR